METDTCIVDDAVDLVLIQDYYSGPGTFDEDIFTFDPVGQTLGFHASDNSKVNMVDCDLAEQGKRACYRNMSI